MTTALAQVGVNKGCATVMSVCPIRAVPSATAAMVLTFRAFLITMLLMAVPCDSNPAQRTPTFFFCQAARRRKEAGFTLVELLVSIGILAILIGFLIPAAAKSRQRGIELGCVANIRSLGQMVTAYCGDFRDVFPAQTSDRPDFRPPRGMVQYQLLQAHCFDSPMWVEYTGVPYEAKVNRCPADSPSRHAIWFADPSYRLALCMFLDGETLVRTEPGVACKTRARINRLSDVAHPAQKVGVHENDVWHAYKGWMGPGAEYSMLEYQTTTGRGSVWWFDGSAGQMWAGDAKPYAFLLMPWSGGAYRSTLYGVRGVDR